MLCFSAAPAIEDKSRLGITPIFIITTYALMIAVFYQAVNRKLKWRGQEILELAAMPVEDTGNNYTPRPRPAGKTEVSRTEIIRFVNFITSNLICPSIVNFTAFPIRLFRTCRSFPSSPNT